MIKQLQRVLIVCLKADREVLVHQLQELGCLHIEAIDESDGLRKLNIDTETRKRQEVVGFSLTRIDAYLSEFGGTVACVPLTMSDQLLDEVQAGLNQIEPFIQQLTTKRDELEAELDLLPRYQRILHTLLRIMPESANQPDTITTGIFVSRAYAGILNEIQEAMLAVTGGHGETSILDVDADTRAMLLTFPVQDAAAIDNLLSNTDVSRLRLPDETQHQSLDTLMENLDKRSTEILVEIASIKDQLKLLGNQWRERLSQWHVTLENALEALRILKHFGETEMTHVIRGWLPEEQVAEIRSRLEESVSEAIVVYEEELTPQQRKAMPIALHNSPPIRPFERLVSLRALPGADDIDPSPLMALFMPLFFGMMLGDIGYGAVLFLMMLYLRRRLRNGIIHDLLSILLVGSIWSIIWGLMFGELFGTLGAHLGMHALWFPREHPEDLVSLLVFAIGVGAVHQILGLLIGIWQAWQHREKSHLLERGGMLVSLLALFLIAGSLVEWLPETLLTPAIAVLIIGIVILSASMGWLGILMGPLEFIGLIGNVLSYLRIAAIGLASVYLAVVANEIAGLVGSIVVGILIAVLIHALNIALGAFSPSIQSLRLQYVEFFRKFYTGGGQPYTPFQRTRV